MKKKQRKSLFEVEEKWEKEWQGMPEFNQKDRTSFQQIIVHFKNKEDVQKFAKLIDRKITDRTNSIWYPGIKNKNLLNRVCTDES